MEKKPIFTTTVSRIQCWAVALSAYAYWIVYRKGVLHANGDSCSRLLVEIPDRDLPKTADVVLLLSAIDDRPITLHHFQRDIEADPLLTQLRTYIPKDGPRLFLLIFVHSGCVVQNFLLKEV